MPKSPQEFADRITHLKADLVGQGRRVQTMLERAFESVFARDNEQAQRVVESDDIIDAVDVEIEKRSVALLSDATAVGAALQPEHLRMVLTIVKINNELERIADVATAVADLVPSMAAEKLTVPETHRVITNSVVGIIRDSVLSLERNDGQLAKVVLASEDAVEAFKTAILRDAQVQVSTGRMPVDQAFLLHELATQCEIMASHCTNIAEQVLYAATGTIVRHMGGHWQEVPPKP